MYEELILPIITALLGSGMAAITTYVIAKKLINPMEMIEEIFDFIATDEETHQKLYLLGGLLGKGARDGFGIDRLLPKGKKGGLEGLFLDLISGYVKGKVQPNPENNLMETLK